MVILKIVILQKRNKNLIAQTKTKKITPLVKGAQSFILQFKIILNCKIKLRT